MRTGAQKARGVLSSRTSASTCTLLCVGQRDAHAAQRALEGGQQVVAGEDVVVFGGAHEVRQVGLLELGARQAELGAGDLVEGALVEPFGGLQEHLGGAAQHAEVDGADFGEQLGVGGVAEVADELVEPPPALVVERIEDRRRVVEPGVVDAAPAVAVGFVGLHDAGVAQTDLLAVDVDFGARFGVGDLVGDLFGLVAQKAFDAEVEQEREPPAVVVGGGGVVETAQRAH